MEVERATCVAPATCVALPGGVKKVASSATAEEAIFYFQKNKKVASSATAEEAIKKVASSAVAEEAIF